LEAPIAKGKGARKCPTFLAMVKDSVTGGLEKKPKAKGKRGVPNLKLDQRHSFDIGKKICDPVRDGKVGCIILRRKG